MRIEHAQLQVEDGLAGDGKIEVAGLDDAGMNRANRNVEDAFSVRGPVDVPLTFERRQHGVEREILAQRMHVGPVIVQGHAPRIGMSDGFEAEPILNLALLPVDGRQLGGQRRERGMIGGNGRLQDQPVRVARPVKDVVVVENPLRLHPVFGKDGHQPRRVRGDQMPRDRGDVGAVQQNGELARYLLFHRADLLREKFANFLQKRRHCPLTTRAALLIN